MSKPYIDVIECESVAVRCHDGEIFEFPVVDNKNLFPHFFRTYADFSYQVQTNLIHGVTAIYKKHKNISFLVGTLVKGGIVNDEVMKIIEEDDRLTYLLK